MKSSFTFTVVILSTALALLATTKPVVTLCLAHHWPIGNNAVTDAITGKSATSYGGSPQFAADRNGVINGAILVNSSSSAWKLPEDTYFQGDTTLTLWVKKNARQYGDYGKLYKIDLFT
jgi:hypothetical protein